MTDKTVVKELMLADISFRDYLAAEAMNAMIATIPLPWSLREQCEGDFYDTAQSAYKMADAMSKARGDMEFKGTPAPWHIDNLITIAINSGYKHVAVVNLSDKVNKDESNANAHLIAAAPELLEALIELTESAKQAIDGLGDLSDAIDTAKAAIAKALGQQ